MDTRPFRLFSYSELRDPVKHFKRPPSKPLSMIAVRPFHLPENGYNHLVMFFAVSDYRKHEFRKLKAQSMREGKLSPYAQSLFDSCFKNWDLDERDEERL